MISEKVTFVGYVVPGQLHFMPQPPTSASCLKVEESQKVESHAMIYLGYSGDANVSNSWNMYMLDVVGVSKIAELSLSLSLSLSLYIYIQTMK